MKRERILEETREALAKTGFFLSRPHGERGLCLDLVARRDDTLLIVKVFQNVDALSKETAHELKVIARAPSRRRVASGSPSRNGNRVAPAQVSATKLRARARLRTISSRRGAPCS